MTITECGDYRLTADFYTRGTWSCATIPKGTVIKITQIDRAGGKVIGPALLDWTYNDMPVERYTAELPATTPAPGAGNEAQS